VTWFDVQHPSNASPNLFFTIFAKVVIQIDIQRRTTLSKLLGIEVESKRPFPHRKFEEDTTHLPNVKAGIILEVANLFEKFRGIIAFGASAVDRQE
jgi:hypothetical protein